MFFKNQNGNVVELLDYYPYGKTRLEETAEGDQYCSDIYENDFKFTGKELDDETGLYYYGARYYDASMGRFISIDPVSFVPKTSINNPQVLNAYSYTLNNPLKYVDVTAKYPVLSQVTDMTGNSTLMDYARTYEEQYKNDVVLGTENTLAAMSDMYGGNFNSAAKDGWINERYTYVDEGGWIDMKHFFSMAETAYSIGYYGAILTGESIEYIQELTEDPSAYSFEDLTSNMLGAYFGANYLPGQLADGKSFSEALSSFFEDLGGLSSDQAKKDHSTVNVEGYGDWDLPEGYTDEYNEPKSTESSTSKDKIKEKTNK